VKQTDRIFSPVKLILCVQYYACATSERQSEIDRCLKHNLDHPAISSTLIWVEPSAPPLPASAGACEVIPLDRRATFADWLELSRQQSDAIILLANADIAIGEGLEHLPTWLPTPRHSLALSRHQPEEDDTATLHPNPQWSQDTWAIRSDAPIEASLLHASTMPLGLLGCDNRIAHVLWSHGFSLSNPCHHIHTLHRHQQPPTGGGQARERLFGACTYVHPALAPGECSELEHTIWSRSAETSGGLTLQLDGDRAEAWPYLRLDSQQNCSFRHQERLRRLLGEGRALGSEDLKAEVIRTQQRQTVPLELPRTAERILLPLSALWQGEIQLALEPSPVVLAIALTVPPSQAKDRLQLESRGPGHDWSAWIQADADPSALARQAPQQLITPPFPRQVGQLRLTLHRPDGQPQEAPAPQGALLDLRVIVATAPVLLAPEEPCGPLKLADFGDRFEVLADAGQLHWVDRFWPWGYQTASNEVAPPLIHEREALFRRGFTRPLLEWKAGLIRSAPSHTSKALLVWNTTNPTEEQAWLSHARLQEPALTGNPCNLYVGLPWATFAQRNQEPQRLIEAYGARIGAIAEVLGRFGRRLAVHSVCQHPQWRHQIHLFQACGISDLWLSHKPRGIDEYEGLRLHPWPMLAAKGSTSDQACPPVPWEQRTGIAEGTNERLERRRFCLCNDDGDADPSRLWQSLAAGCIPVLVGERPELPALSTGAESDLPDWDEVVIVHPANDRPGLEHRLAAISSEEGRHRQILGLKLIQLVGRMTCFQNR
jgi:hypothetical protein